MTREEAREELQWMTNGSAVEAMIIAIAALRGSQPDPKTGLVPCGCGKRAIFYGFDEERGDTKLIHRTAAGCPDCPATTDWEENQDDARRIWNKMMGYKEDA